LACFTYSTNGLVLRTWRTTRTKVKKRFKSNFKIRNKTRLCDLKTKTQELKTRTRDLCVKQTWKQIFIMLTYANMNMIRLWCKIVQIKISVEQTKGNEGSYFYLYPFGDLVQGSF
jgi:hypothetical protein